MTYRVHRVQGFVLPAKSDSPSGYDPARPAVERNGNRQLRGRPWRVGCVHNRVRPSLTEGHLGQGSALCRMVRGPLMRSAARPRRCASCSALCSAWSAACGLVCRAWSKTPNLGNGGRVRRHLCCPVLSMPCQLKSLDNSKTHSFPLSASSVFFRLVLCSLAWRPSTLRD